MTQVAGVRLVPQLKDLLDLLEQCLSEHARLAAALDYGLEVTLKMRPADLPPPTRQPVVSAVRNRSVVIKLVLCG